MKKISFAFLILITLICTLSGCSGSDGNRIGSLSVTVSVRSDYCDMLKQAGKDPFAGKQSSTVTIDGRKYISSTQTAENMSFPEAEAMLKDIQLYSADSADSAPVQMMKSVEIKENNGMFYNSYTLRAVSGKHENPAYRISVTAEMPGNTAQVKGGTVENNAVIFELTDFTQENEIAVYSESNNVAPIAVMISILLIFAGASVIYIKRKQD